MSEWGWDEEEVEASHAREQDERRIEDIEEDFDDMPDLIDDDIDILYEEYIKLLREEKL
jgi:hypothetical protein